MLSTYCPEHGTEVLIPPSGVEGVRNTAEGIEVLVRCVCGWHGRVLTGRTRARTPAVRAA